MSKKEDTPAKAAVIREWDAWIETQTKPVTEHTALLFYGYLQREKRHLLNFRFSGDKWQRVHAWLLRERRVKD